MKQAYEVKQFRGETWDLIETMNGIIEDYTRQGFILTVRQLYYQLVARDIIPNTERSYKRITGIVNDARMAGYMDWSAIEDRTRSFIRRSHWDSPRQIINACASSYFEDMWDTQETRVFVIVEKEALVGVLEGVCYEWDVPLLAARGYPSGTVLREFAQTDLIPAMIARQHCVILHLGDHDPSGIDMTRDLQERLRMFAETNFLDVKRIALNMDQIEEQRPPENPAKSTDARFSEYLKKYGSSSWELDALSPRYLVDLVERRIQTYLSEDAFIARREEVEEKRQNIRRVAAMI